MRTILNRVPPVPPACGVPRLETTLRNFSCLTVGDNIMVAYNSRKYYIDIIEAKPANAITIIETDCEVDFAPPLDYVEPERVPTRPAAAIAQPAAGAAAAAAAATPPGDFNRGGVVGWKGGWLGIWPQK